MAEQFTTMVLKVDLQCCKCYKKVKKVLCKFPEIRDQIYDVKQNTVMIKVVCCCPEKIMQKIRCKGGKTIISIEIIPPAKSKDPGNDKKPPAEKPPDKKPPDKKPPDEKPPDKKPPAEKPPGPSFAWVICCKECHEGRRGGPCQQLCYCRPPPCYGGYYGWPVYDSWTSGCNRGYYWNRCDYYYYEENPSACTIM